MFRIVPFAYLPKAAHYPLGRATVIGHTFPSYSTLKRGFGDSLLAGNR